MPITDKIRNKRWVFSYIFVFDSMIVSSVDWVGYRPFDADSKQSKTKIYEKNHLLVRISAVFGRYGHHLMIVMIFVTQNNF